MAGKRAEPDATKKKPRPKKPVAAVQAQPEPVKTEPKLTPKQELFISYYVQHFNATKAAKQAGYSEDTAYSIGWENLRKPEILEAIEEKKAELLMSADEVLIRLGQQARAEHEEYWEYDAYGQPSINFKKLKEDGLAHLVKELEFSEMTGRMTKLKFYDSQAALVHVGKHHKLFTDNVNHGGKVQTEDVTDDERSARRAARVAQLLNYAGERRTGRNS